MAERASPLEYAVEELRRQVERERRIVADLEASPGRAHLLSTAVLMLTASINRLKAAEEALEAEQLEAPAEGLPSPPAPVGQAEAGISVGAPAAKPETE